MALLYKIVRDNRKNSGNLYYGRAVQINTIDTAGMADIIQRNCTLKKSDVLAVIAELVDVMTDQLLTCSPSTLPKVPVRIARAWER